MTKPTYKEIAAALGSLLAEYAELDGMLDVYAEIHGMTADERRKQRANNRGRDKAAKIWRRLVA